MTSDIDLSPRYLACQITAVQDSSKGQGRPARRSKMSSKSSLTSVLGWDRKRSNWDDQRMSTFTIMA